MVQRTKSLLLIADSDPRSDIIGGVGMYTKQLADRLTDRYDITYVGKKQPHHDKEVPYQVFLANTRPEQSNIGFLIGLFRHSRHLSADIIHAQRPDWLVPFASHKAKRIVTLHGSHAKNMALKKGRTLQLLYHYLEKRGLKSADKVIAVDHQTRNEYVKNYPFLKDKIHVVPVGVDTEMFRPHSKRTMRKKLAIPSAKKVLLYIGRLSKEKRVDEMILLVGKELLIIIGDGEEKERLEILAQGKNVLFTGRLDHEKISQYCAASDVLLLLSTHEGNPTVVLEALATGLPVLATPVGELPYYITKEIGILAKSRFRKHLDELLTRNELLKQSCRNAALPYDWKIIARRLQEVYET